MKNIFLFIIILFIFSSCVSTEKKVVPKEKLPVWVLSPPNDTQNVYYGIGHGHNISYAKKVALQEISSKISIFVGGSTKISSSLNNDVLKKNMLMQINTTTQQKELTSYDTEKTVVYGNKVYVLISINKKQLSKKWNTKLEFMHKNIESSIKLMKSKSQLQQYVTWQQVLPNVDKAITLASLIKTIDSSFNEKKYLNAYLKHQEEAKIISKEINIHMQSGKEFLEIRKVITKQLAEIGLKTTTTKNKSTNASILIEGVESQHIIYKSYFVKQSITIVIVDSKNNIISRKPLNISGSSINSYTSARISASNEINEQFNKNGFFAMLGLIHK